ncbi:MAG TPA: uroporphyrinogen decarboxylase family protein [Anaerolineales bacterium]
MNGKQRIALTMRHQNPDRVPVMCQLSLGHYNLNGGYKPHEIWYETEAFVDATVKLARRYRFDGILVVLTGRPAGYLDRNLAKITEDAEGQTLTWRNGDRTFLPWDDMAHHYPADESKPQRADFDTFDPDSGLDHMDDYLGHTWNVLYHMQEIPEKENAGPFSSCPVPEYTWRMFDLVKAAAGDELSIHGSFYSPLTHFFELFGYENALMGFVTDPMKAHAILGRLADHVIAYGLALARRGADALDLSSAFVAAPFLSRKMYQEFVVPYEKRVTDTVKAAGTVVYTHTCGRIGDRLDLMEQTGTQGIDTLDPPPLGNGDLASAKRDYGQRLFFKGNLNSVAILNYTTPQEVIAEASERIELGKPGAGYILSTACSVAPRVEPWKIELLTPLAEEIGRY